MLVEPLIGAELTLLGGTLPDAPGVGAGAAAIPAVASDAVLGVA